MSGFGWMWYTLISGVVGKNDTKNSAFWGREGDKMMSWAEGKFSQAALLQKESGQ